jgi:hypothetical protein
MADDVEKKPEDEIAALKARVEELERKNKPPEPFVPKPYEPIDWTARMSMPRSAIEAMVAAEPRGFMSGVVHDNRAPTTPAMIPREQVSRPGANVPGGGTGWAHEVKIGPPPGIRYVDQQLDAQDQRDRQERIQQAASVETARKLAEQTETMRQVAEQTKKLAEKIK